MTHHNHRIEITPTMRATIAYILCSNKEIHVQASHLCKEIEVPSGGTGAIVRTIIRDFSREGIPGYPEYEICSDTDGFFATDNTELIALYRQNLRRRAISMFLRSRRMWNRQRSRMTRKLDL